MKYKIHAKTSLALIVAGASLTSLSFSQTLPVYKDKTKSLEARVNDLFRRLTLDEKMDILTGTDFTTRPIPRLGIPAVAMADAGQGVRGGSNTTQGPATAFPAAVAMASTWDPGLVGRIGKAIGEEAHNKGTGVQILLGPAVNIHRSPLGGRNGEYFSEDPFLASRLTVDYVKGMQSTGVAACLKHFAANNEEIDRDFVNVKVDERTLREIYLPAFEAGVKEGHAWTVMSSYNMVNGYHSSANKYLLTDVLKKGWGFDGMVMSDWGGVHETVGAVNAGNDLEMPGPGFLKKENIELALKAGKITEATINENVKRILRTAVRVGVVDGGYVPDHRFVNSDAHKRLTFEAASKGIVLLKNDQGVLPLRRNQLKSIALIGPGANSMQVDALGSPTVQPFYTIQPLAGLKTAAPAVKIAYARGLETGEPVPGNVLSLPEGGGHGLRGDYFANKDLSGAPAFSRTDRQIQFNWTGQDLNGLGTSNYSVRWTGKLTAPTTGRYHFVLSADDGCRMYIDGKRVIDHWIDTAEVPVGTNVNLVAGKSYDLRIEYYQAAGDAVVKFYWTPPSAGRFAEAIKIARQSDVAIVCVSTLGQEGEGSDRPSMPLPSEQDALIEAVASVNKHTIVVLNNGTPVVMTSWLKKVPAVLETWFPGQEGGSALAAILFGDINPSGKLPDTLAARREDYPDYGNFPGTKGQVKYAEGIYVGYRHFDKKNIAPLFPFGHGLSYTTFGYGKASVSAPNPQGVRTVTLNVTNTGKRTGAEVVQIYVHDLKPKVDKPVRELKGFQKVSLAPGQTARVSIKLTNRAFEYFNVPGKAWRADAGKYELQIGSSSRDIRQKTTVTLTADLHDSIR